MKLPCTAGVGIKFKDDLGTIYETVCTEVPRLVYYRITSFRAMSPGAEHWYVSFHTYTLPCRVIKASKKDSFGNKKGQLVHIGGAFCKYMPEGSKGERIDLTRPLTDEERKDKRFTKYGNVSDTQCFNSYDDCIKMAHKEFRKRFGKGWKLVAESSNQSYKWL